MHSSVSITIFSSTVTRELTSCAFSYRYLRGTGWKPLETIQRLESTLKWRREFGLYTHLTADRVEREVRPFLQYPFPTHVSNSLEYDQAKSGTQILSGYDTRGRPAFYMIPSKQTWNTTSETRHLQFAVYMLERCIDLMPPGVEYVPADTPSAQIPSHSPTTYL